METKFKVGQTIGAIERGMGLEEATITRIDDKYYYCRIVNGFAKLPIVAEVNYKEVSKTYL